MALVPRLAGLLRPPPRRGLQHLAVLREEGQLIGYWTRPDSAAAATVPSYAAPTAADQNKCRVVVERFNLPPLPIIRWEEEGGHGGQLVGSGGESILMPKL